MPSIEVDEKRLSQLEENALALQTIANRVLADVAEIRRLQSVAASAKRPKKKKTDWGAVILQTALTGKYYKG